MDYVSKARGYANKVKDKKIPACKYVQQACKRFLKDEKRKDLILDKSQANKWCSFLEKLPHVKGKWAKQGLKFDLSGWQVFCTVNIFGFYVKKTKRRRFRDVYIEVGRKNGKSFWVAGIAVGMLTIDDEYGAEIYCGATTEKQAWEIFGPAKKICERTPALRQRFAVEVNAKTLTILENGSKFEPIIGDPGDGASPSLAIADEYHEHNSSDQVDTMVTGMGARENPIMFKITTAGSDMGGPCYEDRSDLIKVLNGSVVDDSLFGIIYTIDEKDKWDTIAAQKKANPNYGISVDEEFLKGQLAQARRSATKQVAYKTKHLNMWVGAKAAWMNMLAFQACRKKINIEDFKGRRCFVAVDLASKVDMASAAILFPPEGNDNKYSVFVKHYLPEETILENSRYKAWHAAGWLESTPGNVIDFEHIENDLKELRSQVEIVEVPYDPFQATQFSIRMIDEGFPMIEVGATVKNFSEPMKELEVLIISKQIQFNLDPVLMWMFGNVVAKLDKKDNIFPCKERAANKIDGVVALIMNINRITLNTPSGTLNDFLKNPVIV